MTKKSVSSALLIGGAALAILGGARRNKVAEAENGAWRKARGRDAADDAARRYITYIVLPVWCVSGFLDWLWHRQTKIETTSGVKESIMHVVMMAEAGSPILTGLFLEINAGSLALMAAGWLLHELTVAWDVKYTISRRQIFPREQHTHTYMQTTPFNIVMTLACL